MMFPGALLSVGWNPGNQGTDDLLSGKEKLNNTRPKRNRPVFTSREGDKMVRRLLIIIVFTAVVFLSPADLRANNLRISNVSLEDRDPAADTAVVQFDISWDNSWRNTTNHDAAWVFIKGCNTTKATCTTTPWGHAPFKTAGLNPADTSPGTNGDLDIYIPADKKGAFLRRKATGTGTMSSTKVRLTMDYSSANSGFIPAVADTDKIKVRVLGIEMVFIPEGPFYAGDNSTDGTVSPIFRMSATSSAPWYISSEGQFDVKNGTTSGNHYYPTWPGTLTGGSEFSSGPTGIGPVFTVPAAWPKGYAAIYCMKYELTEGQYVDFLHMIAAINNNPDPRDITSLVSDGKDADTWVTRNTVSGGYGSTFTTARPDRAMTYLNWPDLAAYLDWSALRPMTELEYEKIARGPLSPVAGEYVWGSASITRAVTFSISPENGTETFTTAGANAVYNLADFTQGDPAAYGAADINYTRGPARAGIFATSSSTRATAGAGYYGVMELTGNAQEFAVLIGSTDGLLFDGTHGDGTLSSTAGATTNHAYFTTAQATWPGTATGIIISRAQGIMIRGGNFLGAGTTLSGRDPIYNAGYGTHAGLRDARQGGRGVRTYDGTDF
jgi:hypothetical protein